MLGILVSWHSFFEFFNYHLKNLNKFIKFPHRIYVLDNSAEPFEFRSEIPFTYIRNPDLSKDPSTRHMRTLEIGLAKAWKECDSFLIFDNDMIFCKEWEKEPEEELVYVPTHRGMWWYCWMNLLYFKKFQIDPPKFSTWNCPVSGQMTDSGGNTGNWLKDEKISKKEIEIIFDEERQINVLPNYRERLMKICNEHKILFEAELYELDKVPIFHFVKMSNYMKYPAIYLDKKKNLILDVVKENNLI